MTDLLLKLSQTFDIIVVTFPQIQELSHLNKRNVELSVKSFQYGTQAACEVATNKCNSHGRCIQVGDNWACQCEPSFNKTTSKLQLGLVMIVPKRCFCRSKSFPLDQYCLSGDFSWWYSIDVWNW